MFHRISCRVFLIPAASALCLLFSQAVLQGASKSRKKNDARLRIVCVSTLPEKQNVVLASRDEKGKWREFGKVELRPSNITDWLPAATGEIHLALPSKDGLNSICSFQYPVSSNHHLVAVVADEETSTYKTRVIDPKRIGFAKGTVLVINFSPQSGEISLGSKIQKVDAGSESVIKPAAAEDGTYRMQVSYADAGGKSVPCHDRHVRGDPESREMLFLLPDKTLGMRVVTLPVFGPLD